MMLSPRVRGQASKKHEQMALAAEQDGHGETVNVSFDTLLLLSFFFLKLGSVFLLFVCFFFLL
jgi:hypothetical protein